VHALGIDALASAIGVRAEVRDALRENRGQRVRERRVLVEPHATRRMRGGALAARQRVAALRLAAVGGAQVEPFVEDQRELEQLAGSPCAQLELDLVDRRAALARDDPALVESSVHSLSPLRSTRRVRRNSVRNTATSASRHDLDRGARAAPDRDPREIGWSPSDRRLELAALEQPARRRALALHGLIAPRCRCAARAAEVRRGEVVILGVESTPTSSCCVTARADESLRTRGWREQPPQIVGRRVELQLDLSMGVHADGVLQAGSCLGVTNATSSHPPRAKWLPSLRPGPELGERAGRELLVASRRARPG
jgi:hypothetical protein